MPRSAGALRSLRAAGAHGPGQPRHPMLQPGGFRLDLTGATDLLNLEYEPAEAHRRRDAGDP